MALTRDAMITVLHDLGYEYVKVKGGRAKLEEAPDGNIYWAYKNITARIQKIKTVEQRRKENQLK